MEDELQEMEEAVPEMPPVEEPVLEEQPTTVFEAVPPEVEEEEEVAHPRLSKEPPR